MAQGLSVPVVFNLGLRTNGGMRKDLIGEANLKKKKNSISS
jgi:hypothetical protein